MNHQLNPFRSQLLLILTHQRALLVLAAANGTRIIGLHAHTGSGITDMHCWPNRLRALFTLLHTHDMPHVRYVNIGGGFAVADTAAATDAGAADLAAIDELVLHVLHSEPELSRRIQIWTEPGRCVSGMRTRAYVQIPSGKQWCDRIARDTNKAKGEDDIRRHRRQHEHIIAAGPIQCAPSHQCTRSNGDTDARDGSR